jgi:hypothetical protein
MKRIHHHILLVSLLTLVIIIGCKKTYQYPSAKASDYMPMQKGKYITYRLDSLVFLNFGTQDSTFRYLARDVVDDSISDNLGRPSWRIIRYLSDTTGTAEWTPIESYMVTPTSTSVEVVENNLRFVKLVSPVVDGFTWSGNSYIESSSAFSEFTYMYGWNYVYDSTGLPFNAFNTEIPNTVTIHQADESTGSTADTVFSTRTFSEEVYAKGIGLVYKNFIHWEYQPPNANVPVGSTQGYGIKLTMVDHN